MTQRSRKTMLSVGAMVVALAPAYAWPEAKAPDLSRLAAGKDGKVDNRSISAGEKAGKPTVRLDEREGDGLAWWPDLTFGDGELEFDARGKDEPQKSFLGIAFHGADHKTYDAVYLRPFNFRASEPERRKHAVQYVSLPDYDWKRLRSEQPDKFEAQVAPVPDPNGWFHVRVTIRHPNVSVFVDAAAEPCLKVRQLSQRRSGWVGFWVGNGSGGEFANLRITPSTKP